MPDPDPDCIRTQTLTQLCRANTTSDCRADAAHLFRDPVSRERRAALEQHVSSVRLLHDLVAENKPPADGRRSTRAASACRESSTRPSTWECGEPDVTGQREYCLGLPFILLTDGCEQSDHCSGETRANFRESSSPSREHAGIKGACSAPTGPDTAMRKSATPLQSGAI